MLGLWIVRDLAGDALLARVHGELYVLAFSSAVRASRARELFGVDGSPFLTVAANLRGVVTASQAAGARGVIVDYDHERAVFSSAHQLPVDVATTAVATGR
jgi:hypothetical protein